MTIAHSLDSLAAASTVDRSLPETSLEAQAYKPSRFLPPSPPALQNEPRQRIYLPVAITPCNRQAPNPRLEMKGGQPGSVPGPSRCLSGFCSQLQVRRGLGAVSRDSWGGPALPQVRQPPRVLSEESRKGRRGTWRCAGLRGAPAGSWHGTPATHPAGQGSCKKAGRTASGTRGHLPGDVEEHVESGDLKSWGQ